MNVTRQFLLAKPEHDQHLLPVSAPLAAKPPLAEPSVNRIMRSVCNLGQDTQIVIEFRNKLRLAEELIAKLAFNLQEIQGARRKIKSSLSSRGPLTRGKTLQLSRRKP